MILVAGSANLDFVVRVPHVPAPGETVLGDDLRTYPGGKGANQAIAAARAGGARTRLLLALGEDAFAAPIEASLAEAGVEPRIVRVRDRATGTALISVAAGGENAITVAPGANAALAPEHLPDLAGVTHLLMQLETPLPTVLAYARAARAAGVTVVLNAAPARALPSELLARVDVLVVNEGELATVADGTASLAGPADAAAAGDAAALRRARLARLDVPCVVVTLGAQGCVARVHGVVTAHPGFRVEAVDTTAAGDTFCGVFAATLAHGLELPAALRRANGAAALACTRHGAQASIPGLAAVEAFLRSQNE